MYALYICKFSYLSPLVYILRKSSYYLSFSYRLNICVSYMLKVKKEIEMCYELIHRLGRGVVYLGSARMGPGHEHYIQTQELARQARSFLFLHYNSCAKEFICILIYGFFLKFCVKGSKPIGVHFMVRGWTRAHGCSHSRCSSSRKTSWWIQDW